VSDAFRAALNGSGDARELARRLKRLAPQGTTEGSLFVPLESLRKTLQATAGGQIHRETAQPVSAGIVLASHRP
jgi:hypothetical protein